ncbi:TrpB-like pyridoxal phosphate-dependent enzyme [Glycomyces luteolus]|uniref:tryptophan synthase n=1 Tax=Glycomyces luteolus TaxID=2670330 RepID=A0A9X3SRW3_9ACTN|nr:TrpB-like pyridoxal phosphate-dependent enzyme [Glycomyces luteolus]MDA1361856.1 TrpB-like pyridoxal phosphate-dependent enzyme [Glycomyces luteolus]
MTAPRYWYNIAADHPELAEDYLDPATGRALKAEDLADVFPPELAEQEFDHDRTWIPIPEPVREAYSRWRPSPLRRARGLERALGTKCRLYYKYEGGSPIGSHKANSGVAQAHYAKRAGARRVVAETGAGQWGTAISMGSAFQELDCEVFMVRNSFDSKPGRRLYMETFGSTVHASPSPLTSVGKEALRADPDSPGSLGLAIAEAVESAKEDRRTFYSLGSAFNFVCMHQTVIGLELAGQLAEADVEPDLLISCIGGGSSFAGLVFPFFGMGAKGRKQPKFLAVESNAVPTVTAGEFAYDHGDSAKLTPLVRMYTLGHRFSPPGIHAGGLRYHGLSPQVSKFIHDGHGSAVAIPQIEVFEAALKFTRSEGIIPAPEAAHSVAAAIRTATEHRGEELDIVFLLTGHGHFDMTAYGTYIGGGMEESATPTETISASLRESIGGIDRPEPQQVSKPVASGKGSDSFQEWWRRHFDGAATPATAEAKPAPAAPKGAADLSGHAVVTTRTLGDLAADATEVRLAAGAVVTPLAQDELSRRSIRIVRNS